MSGNKGQEIKKKAGIQNQKEGGRRGAVKRHCLKSFCKPQNIIHVPFTNGKITCSSDDRDTEVKVETKE